MSRRSPPALLARGALAAGRAIAGAVQRTLIYPAPPRARAPRVAGGRLVSFETAGGGVGRALFVPPGPDEPTLVHFHGNAETLADVAPLVELLSGAGLGVYGVEYPGYGLCRGRPPSEAALYDAADAALRHLGGELGVDAGRVVLQGQSLGTGVATEMSVRGFGARLVLISPFTSMTAMIRRFAPVLPPALTVPDRFDNLQKAPAVPVPALVVHGARDTLVPYAMGEAVARALPRAELLVSAHAGHNDLFGVDGPRILRRIIDFSREAT